MMLVASVKLRLGWIGQRSEAVQQGQPRAYQKAELGKDGSMMKPLSE
jgi:hypothetical protein